MAFCLLKKHSDKVKEALKSGEINPEKLSAMTSKQRQEFLSKFVGEQNAPKVNALFESKLLLKNQKAGMVTWAKSLIGVPKEVRRDIISRIERLDKVLDPKSEAAFLKDLASQKLGIGEVTFEEAKTITEMSERIQKTKEEGRVTDNKGEVSWRNEEARLEHGASLVALGEYTGSLLAKSKEKELLSFMKEEDLLGKAGAASKDIGNLALKIGDMGRAIVTTFDVSPFFRQDRKVLTNLRTTDIWAKNFARSLVEGGKVLFGNKNTGEKILLGTKADVWSRENALNGNYNRGNKLDIGIREEFNPKTKLELIPVLGRGVEASRVVAEASSMRIRADIADRFYKMAEKQGIDLKNKVEVGAINEVINSMTGRGDIGRLSSISQKLNPLFFSVKFWKSQIDTITQPVLAKSKFARKRAAENTIGVAVSTALAMLISESIAPDSVETDPTSADFGKLKFGKGTRFDLTGGNSSLIVLAARLATQSKKSSISGVKKEIGKTFGSPDGVDLLFSYMQNKTSPLINSVILPLARQRTFEGEDPTINNTLMKLMKPIIVETGIETSKIENATLTAAAVLADFVGISVGTYVFEDNWNKKTTKEMTQFKEKVGQKEFNEGNDEYNQKVHDGITSDEYMSSDEKQKDLDKIKRDAKKEVFKKHRFKPKR